MKTTHRTYAQSLGVTAIMMVAGTAACSSNSSTGTSGDQSVAINGSLAIDRPDWNGLSSTSSKCDGYAGYGYGDLAPGAAVRVYDLRQQVIGTGVLQPGDLINLGKSDSQCLMRFTVTGLPHETSYSVQVANRPSVQFSSADVANDQVTIEAGGS